MAPIDDGTGAANNPSDRTQRRVNHQGHAGRHAQSPEVPPQGRSRLWWFIDHLDRHCRRTLLVGRRTREHKLPNVYPIPEIDPEVGAQQRPVLRFIGDRALRALPRLGDDQAAVG